MSQRWRRLAAGAGLCVLIAGCRVDVDVTIRVEPDASGDVTVAVELDPDAAARARGLAGLDVRDLEAAGWTISGPTATAEEGLVVRATKPFRSPAELSAIVAEIGGPDGLLRDVSLTRERPFAEIELTLTGVLDPSGGLAAWSDPELTEVLGGTPFGVDMAAVEAELGADPASLVSVTVRPDLAGVEEEPGREWTTTLDQSDPVPFSTTSTTQLDEPRRWALLALASLAGAVALIFVQVVRAGLRARRR